jgi:uncharacterized coiled-coil DUF342 family protein
MRLEEIEKRQEVQKGEAESIGQEVQEHKERLGQLEESLQQLQAASSDVESDELNQAIQETQQARQETERRVETLRGQRDELVQENDELTQRCQQSLEKRQGAQQLMQQMLNGFRADREGADVANPAIQRVGQALDKDTQRSAQALEDLKEARQRLDALGL